MANSFDAILVLSFGGPEGPDDVLPFLRNVLRGRNVPDNRMREVARHYEIFGGVSPINQQNRELIAALSAELKANGPALPIYWGNRNWHPYLAETLRQMRDDGIKSALAFVTSAYSSYSGCRQYLDDIVRARAEVGEGVPEVHKIRAFFNHPGFIEANSEHLLTALAAIPTEDRDFARVAFTAHSIPESMSNGSAYLNQLNETCRLVGEATGYPNWQLVFQSRSGPPTQPWLGPDICEHLRSLKTEGVRNVVVMPVGFVSDHMEVLYDLDVEARRVAEEIGLGIFRGATVGTHPSFIQAIRSLILERFDPNIPRLAQGSMGPSHDECAPGCCPSGAPWAGASERA
jgi:ferrochelatase